MDSPDVALRVQRDIDDVLATLPLVSANPRLVDRLFDQLVDLLLESILVSLHAEVVEGGLAVKEYGAELARLASQCRTVGLLADAP